MINGKMLETQIILYVQSAMMLVVFVFHHHNLSVKDVIWGTIWKKLLVNLAIKVVLDVKVQIVIIAKLVMMDISCKVLLVPHVTKVVKPVGV